MPEAGEMQQVLAAVRDGYDTVALIADHTGRHVNTVRAHLRTLVAEGLVVRQSAPPEGRGRPRSLYRPARGVRASRPRGPWPDRLDEAATGLLLDGYGTTSPSPEAARRGAAIAEDLPLPDAPLDARASLDDLDAVLSGLGFDPVLADTRVVLRRCPLLQIAERLPEVSCALHAGLVERRLERTGAHWTADVRPFADDGFCVVDLTLADRRP